MIKKILISSMILAAGLWIGCTHEIPSSFDINDLPAAPKAPTDVRITVGDNVLGLTWNMTDASGITKYFIYRSNFGPDSFELYDSSTVMSYLDEGVQNGVLYYYRVSALSSDNIEGYPSVIVYAVPGIFSIAINNNAEYTNNRSVKINPVAPDATTYIMLSNTDDFSNSKWLNFAASVSWELTEGDGQKIVYGKFKDARGNETAEAYSDDIELDTKAQIDTLYIAGGGSHFSAGEVIRLIMDTGEAGGAARVEIDTVGTLTLFDNGSNGDAVADDGIYQFDYVVPPNIEVVDAAVKGSFTDRAGNRAPDYYLAYLVTISNPSNGPQLGAAGANEAQVDLSWISPCILDFNQYPYDDSGKNQ